MVSAEYQLAGFSNNGTGVVIKDSILLKKCISLVNSTNNLKPPISDGSRHPEVFCKKGVLRYYAKFTGKNLCQSLFFNNVAGLRLKACNVIKKRDSGTGAFL